MERPNLKDTHPETNSRKAASNQNGGHLTIDGSGRLKEVARGGVTQGFVFTDGH